MIIFNKAICPSCGAPLKISKNTSIANCKSCGLDFIVEETKDANLLGTSNKNKSSNSGTQKAAKKTVSFDKIKIKVFILIFSLILIAIGTSLVTVFNKGYNICLDDGTIICTDIYKYKKSIGQEFFDYKVKAASNITVDTNNRALFIESDNITYELLVNNLSIKDDGFIYVTQLPDFGVSTVDYSVMFHLVRINKSLIILGWIFIGIGIYFGLYSITSIYSARKAK